MASETRAAGFESGVSGWQAETGHHYTVAELADAWNVSDDFIRDLFPDEKDVIRWVRNRRGKRRYVVLRIPAPVAERAYRRAQQRRGERPRNVTGPLLLDAAVSAIGTGSSRMSRVVRIGGLRAELRQKRHVRSIRTVHDQSPSCQMPFSAHH
jgi:hypothetical protein